jgi:hypothetical protein
LIHSRMKRKIPPKEEHLRLVPPLRLPFLTPTIALLMFSCYKFLEHRAY